MAAYAVYTFLYLGAIHCIYNKMMWHIRNGWYSSRLHGMNSKNGKRVPEEAELHRGTLLYGDGISLKD